MGVLDALADLFHFGGDLRGPLGVLGSLPGEIENAEGVFRDLAFGVDLHRNRDKWVVSGFEGTEAFGAGAKIDGANAGHGVLGLEARKGSVGVSACGVVQNR